MATNSASLNTPYLFLTGVVLIAVVFLFTVMRPMMDNANELKQQIATESQTLKNKVDFLSSLNIKIQQLAAIPDVEKQMATVLPDTDRTQDTLRIIHEYATQAGLTVISVVNNSAASAAKTNATRARGDILSLPQEVRTVAFGTSVVGSYEQVKLFLSLLGKSPRLIDVQEVSFSSVPTQPGQVTSQMKMQLYSQPTSRASGV